MVLRKLTMALLSVGVMLPGLTHALAVQNIKTHSALGEPFRAEVELSDTGDLTEEDIKVALANPEDFQRLGIEQGTFLTELRFEVVMKNTKPIIKISSHRRVSEPFLDFVIRISWPNNTRLQEVTAFLDPPTVKSTQIDTPAAPVVAHAPVYNNTNVIAAPLNVEPPPMDEDPMAVAQQEDNTYQVRKNDTLWNIARRVRPNATVSVPHMMKVLHQANPQAFIANNINMLKNGQVLRVPTLADAQDAARMADTNSRVVVPQTAAKPLARQQIDATNANKTPLTAQKTPRAHMKLIAPTGNVQASAGGNSAKKSVNGQQQGAKRAGQVATATSRNQKTNRELATLESQLQNNDRKIALQNARLAELQAQLKARRLQAEQAAKQKMTEKTALEKKALATMACAVATQSFLSTEAKAADAPAKEGGSSMMPIIGGGVLLVIIIAAIVMLKGKKSEPPKPAAPAPKPAATPPAQQAAKPATPVAPKPAPVVEEKKPLDPLEEVKAYLEMERYPQAVGILNKALVQTPDRADIHLKLLEIFVKQKDRQAFDEQYAKLELLGELEATMEAEKLKSQLPAPPKPATAKEEHIEFERVAKPAAPAADMPSLEDLEKDFAMSLSQPNLKALDIEIRPDPVKEPEPTAVQTPDMEATLGGLEFSFSKAETPVKVEDAGLEFKLDLPVAESKEEAKKSLDTGLSLDSLDDFLAEHKVEITPAIEEPTVEPAPSIDFEKALADFKEETKEAEPELNLTEGFELEEFNLTHAETPAETGLEALDVDFSIDEAKAELQAEETSLPSTLESVDLKEAAAAFDQDLAEQMPEEATDELDLDFDLQMPSDDVLADLNKEFSFLAGTDENTTRLELARAYVDMGDRLGARDLLEEVIADGNASQKTEAQGILMRIG